jgi:hypothetical protein
VPSSRQANRIPLASTCENSFWLAANAIELVRNRLNMLARNNGFLISLAGGVEQSGPQNSGKSGSIPPAIEAVFLDP